MTGYARYLVVAMAVVALLVAIGNVWFVHRSLCLVVTAQVAVYAETPPSTVAGANARDSWQHLAGRLYC